jgi:mannose-6-phosphate isomerase-like protein (cupin superfamily)
MIERIVYKKELLSIIIRANYRADGIQFFTADDSEQQLAYMSRPKGYEIPPHVHNPVKREVYITQEVLYIKSGIVRVDYYDSKKNYLESRNLYTGDVILLASGGHGFFMCEDSEIIEVKQGPYAQGLDKTRFNSIDNNQVRMEP